MTSAHEASDPGSIASATELNVHLRHLERDNTPGAQTSSDEPASQSPLVREVHYLEGTMNLSEAASVADWPHVGGVLSRIPILGSALSFVREVLISLWLKAHLRSPVRQQIRFNRAVARALRTISWYVDDQDRLSTGLDHEIVALRRDMGLADHDSLILLRRLEAVEQRLELLSAELESLRSATNRARNVDDT